MDPRAVQITGNHLSPLLTSQTLSVCTTYTITGMKGSISQIRCSQNIETFINPKEVTMRILKHVVLGKEGNIYLTIHSDKYFLIITIFSDSYDFI